MKTILFLIENKKSPQYRYRVKNVMEALEASQKYKAKLLLTHEIRPEKKLPDFDLLVILRQTAKQPEILEFIQKTKEAGRKVLFDLDDLVFNYKDLLLLTWTIRARNVLYWLGYTYGVRRIAKKVDGFVTTNEFLSKKLERSFGKPCVVIRNSLNQTQVEVSDKLVQESAKRKSEGFKIGYFSGSPTHERDLALIEPEIMKFMKQHADVKLEIVGYMKFSENIKELADQKRVISRPMMGVAELQREIAGVDVNLAPLVINDFTNSKSELKFFEAGAVETTTIASPSYTFRNCITDGENGFLAQPGEWYDKLEYLYEHPTENRKIAKKARKYALKHYYGKEFLEEVEKAYDQFAEGTQGN